MLLQQLLRWPLVPEQVHKLPCPEISKQTLDYNILCITCLKARKNTLIHLEIYWGPEYIQTDTKSTPSCKHVEILTLISLNPRSRDVRCSFTTFKLFAKTAAP